MNSVKLHWPDFSNSDFIVFGMVFTFVLPEKRGHPH